MKSVKRDPQKASKEVTATYEVFDGLLLQRKQKLH